jgi:hypothetical protein
LRFSPSYPSLLLQAMETHQSWIGRTRSLAFKTRTSCLTVRFLNDRVHRPEKKAHFDGRCQTSFMFRAPLTGSNATCALSLRIRKRLPLASHLFARPTRTSSATPGHCCQTEHHPSLASTASTPFEWFSGRPQAPHCGETRRLTLRLPPSMRRGASFTAFGRSAFHRWSSLERSLMASTLIMRMRICIPL